MTDDDHAANVVQWALGAQIPMLHGAPGIEILRPVTAQELERLERATALLQRLAAAAEYGRAVGLLKTVDERHTAVADRDRPAPIAALGPLTDTIVAVCAALADVPTALIDQARGDLPEADAEAFAQHVETIAASDVWSLALALPVIAGDRRAHFTISDRQVRLTGAGLEALSRAAQVPDQLDEPVLGLLQTALLLAQDMLGHRLVAYRDLIDEQGLVVRLLAAEVQLGAPALVAIAQPEQQGDEQRQQLSFKPLPLDRIAVLQVAVRNAEQALGEQDPPGEAIGTEIQGAGEDDADAIDADVDGGKPDTTEHEVEHHLPGLAPIDDRLLLEHARTLPGEAERAWSAALDAIGQDEAHAELAVRWQAVLTTLARKAQLQGDELTNAGVDASMPLPGDPSILALLSLGDDPRAQWLAASVGQMAALQAVVEAYQQIMEGSGEPTFREPESPRWWESGAFGALRARSGVLERLAEEVDTAQRRLLGEKAPSLAVPVDGPWTYRLQLADEAQARGDWEAAIVHLWLALRQRAAQLAGVDIASIPDSFEDRLAADPDIGGYGPALRLLADVAQRLLAGDPPPLGLSVALAGLLTPPIRELCASLSDVLPRALTDPDAAPGT